MHVQPAANSPVTRRAWAKLIVGLLVGFVALQGSATALGSDRGQAGIVIALVVAATLVVVQRLLFAHSFLAVAFALGLGKPKARGLLTGAVAGLVLILVVHGYALVTSTTLSPYPGWPWLVIGLFAQAGIAEEMLFRGYLFGNFRRVYPFWRAAGLSTGPFVIVHLLMFVTLAWPVALAAMLLAVAISFPLAHLFELGGRTIWAPAIVHCVVQGTLKVIVSDPVGMELPLVWMAASAVLPYFVFLIRIPGTD